MINRVEIKMDAKVLVRTARVSPIVMTAIVMAICFVLERVVDLDRRLSLRLAGEDSFYQKK